MTPNQARLIRESPVIEAFARGQPIQYWFSWSKRWEDIEYVDLTCFEQNPALYRIKPLEAITHYDLKNKPRFKDGDKVFVDMAALGGEGVLKGKIVGFAHGYIIEHWLVQFDTGFSPTYPFKVLQVPHTAFIKST